MPLGGAQPAVQNRDALEAIGESTNGLWRERDFRHQHDRLFLLLDDAPNRLKIDFRLATAGDAVQETDGESRRLRLRGCRSVILLIREVPTSRDGNALKQLIEN